MGEVTVGVVVGTLCLWVYGMAGLCRDMRYRGYMSGSGGLWAWLPCIPLMAVVTVHFMRNYGSGDDSCSGLRSGKSGV
jgi:hypothetical protein